MLFIERKYKHKIKMKQNRKWKITHSFRETKLVFQLFQNIHTFTYQRILLHTLFCLFLEFFKSLQGIIHLENFLKNKYFLPSDAQTILQNVKFFILF